MDLLLYTAYCPVACAGFILAWAENFFRGGQKKIRGGRIAPEGSKIFFCPPLFVSAPPAEFDSAPGAEQTRGWEENLFIPKALIRTFHTSFLTTQ